MERESGVQSQSEGALNVSSVPSEGKFAAMDKPKVQVASKYETQSEGELMEICGPPAEESKQAENQGTKDKSESPPSTKKTGRAKRKERRLRKEPANITGEDGPSGVHVLDFVEARATEMNAMVKALGSKGGSKLTAQKLPRHMRRRAASHNVKRLPRRCHEAALREMEKSKADAAPNKKKPSRKQRRNKKNLRPIFAQRQKHGKWLETHIWHAKRMKMVDKYGHRLAEHRADKGVRAAHKSLMYGCLLSDISYYGCVQVMGPQLEVIKILAPLFSSDTGPTIAGKAFLKGTKEGNAILYRRGQYPHGAVGPVQFLWEAPPPRATPPETESVSLWLWSHAASHIEVLSEVTACVEAYRASKEKEEEDLLVTVRDMNSDLVRFHLIGPRSHALLMEALKPFLKPESDQPESILSDNPPGYKHPSQWWKDGDITRGNFDQHCQLLSDTYDSIKSMPSPAHFQKGTVLGMTVLDPRFFTPSSKVDMVSKFYPLKKNGYQQMNGTKVEDDQPLSKMTFKPKETAPEALTTIHTMPTELAYSPLWNGYMRLTVTSSKQPTHIVNQARAQLHSSGLDIDSKAAKIPVLLIQQTLGLGHSRDRDVACGWDVILPSNWGNEFFQSFVYHGARACGLNELQKCSLEMLSQHFPVDFPDTLAGQAHNADEKARLIKKYKLYPPAKRRNYGKFLIASPFDYPWQELVSVWSPQSRIEHSLLLLRLSSKRIKLEEEEETGNAPDFDYALEGDRARKRVLRKTEEIEAEKSNPGHYVLRSLEALSVLRQFIEYLFSHKGLKCTLDELQYQLKKTLQDFDIDSYLRNHSSALLGVKVQMYQRGTLSSHDVLSIPKAVDFPPLLSSSRWRPHGGPVEIIDPKGMAVMEGDSVAIGVTSLAKKQMSLVKEKRKVVEKDTKKRAKEGDASRPAVSVLPSAVTDFKLHPVQPFRETFGYITSAGYRLTTSVCSGLGFCTFSGFLEAVCQSYLAPGVSEPLALARGDSTQYWFVKLSLV